MYLYWFIIGKLDNYSVLYIVLTSLLSFDRVEMTMKFMRTQGQWVTQWPVHRTPLNKCQRSFQGYNDRLHWMWRGMEGGGLRLLNWLVSSHEILYPSMCEMLLNARNKEQCLFLGCYLQGLFSVGTDPEACYYTILMLHAYYTIHTKCCMVHTKLCTFYMKRFLHNFHMKRFTWFETL